jgi:membrane dipeptidase
MKLSPLVAVWLMFGLSVASAANAAQAISEDAKQLHESALVLDTHLDTPANFSRPGWRIADSHEQDADLAQVDLPRMKAGGLDGGFWVIYTGQGPRDPAGNREARDHALERLVAIHKMLAANAADFQLALTADDAERIAAEGKRVVFISMENASPLASDPTLLSAYHRLGLRMLGIVHVLSNDFGDSSTDAKGPEWGGLSPKGRELVKEANRLGIVLDVSHASDAVFDQVLELSQAPIILSHTSADAVYDHPRNIDDARIRKLAAKGGVIHVNAYGGYLIDVPKIPAREQALSALSEKYGSEGRLSPEQIQAYLRERRAIDRQYPVPRATLDDYMRHLLHILNVAGPEHVGIGADWDGGGGVVGLEDVSALPAITQRLRQAGYTDQDIRNIWGGNVLRVLRAVQGPAGRAEAK